MLSPMLVLQLAPCAVLCPTSAPATVHRALKTASWASGATGPPAVYPAAAALSSARYGQDALHMFDSTCVYIQEQTLVFTIDPHVFISLYSSVSFVEYCSNAQRAVLRPNSNGGRPCASDLIDVRACQSQPCPQDCQVASWSRYTLDMCLHTMLSACRVLRRGLCVHVQLVRVLCSLR